MVSSLLGGQMTGIQNAISKTTGLLPAVSGQILALATPMVMGYISKMFVGQKMDQAGLTSLRGARSKMALQSSPGAAHMASQLPASPEAGSGIMGMREKLMKG
jgi:hypothetical protein